ncbi:hypothetical protein Lal_00032317 [Lupinus albus]|nr:hypothetical protein Lal_00032317 [Lupinus albus]
MCLQEESAVRPLMIDVVTALINAIISPRILARARDSRLSEKGSPGRVKSWAILDDSRLSESCLARARNGKLGLLTLKDPRVGGGVGGTSAVTKNPTQHSPMDLKSSNILQDNEYNAKLSDYGLAKLADLLIGLGYKQTKFHLYEDEFVFRKRIWEPRALPWRTTRWLDLKSSNILQDNEYNAKLSDYGLAKLAAMCLQEESAARPLMIDVVTALINANSGNLGHCPGEQRDGCALPIPINVIEITTSNWIIISIIIFIEIPSILRPQPGYTKKN